MYKKEVLKPKAGPEMEIAESRRLIKPMARLESTEEKTRINPMMRLESTEEKTRINPMTRLEPTEENLIEPSITLNADNSTASVGSEVKTNEMGGRTIINEHEQKHLMAVNEEIRETSSLYVPQSTGMILTGLYMPEQKSSTGYIKPMGMKPLAHEVAEYIKSRIKIYIWDGNIFIFDARIGAYKHCHETNEMNVIIDAIARDKIIEMGSTAAYGEICRYLKYDHRMARESVDVLPRQCWVFKDVVVDIINNFVTMNTGQYFVISALQCDYNHSAQCPYFDQFLLAVTGQDENLIELIWQIIGYILSTDMNAKSFFTFIGPKDTGKSLLLNVIQAFFLPERVSGLGITDFGKKYALDDLVGTQLNICADLSDENIPANAVGAIKQLTGNDRVRTERKYRSAKTFYSTTKLVFSSNFRLKSERPDPAFFERQVMVPFLYPVPRERQDKQLLGKLIGELSGIAVKAMAAYGRLVINNYIFPEGQVYTLPDNMVYDETKIIQEFVELHCDFSDPSAKVFTQDVFGVYQTFCISRHVPSIEECGRFSSSFNLSVGQRCKNKKINIQGKILQGYVGLTLK